MLAAAGAVLAQGSAVAQSPDTAALRRDARRAESEYESSVRRYAPVLFTTPRGRPCDEIVGRYCVYYETGGDSLPAEPMEISVRRERAIEALAAAHAQMPARIAVAFPLVRYLAQAERSEEAVRVARAFAHASPDSAAAHMLLGYAFHADRNTPAAATAFDAWLAALPSDERTRISDAGWLLDREERDRYEGLGETARQEYSQQLWRYADPLYLTPGNEVWTDHLARHALAHMLARRRGITGVESWGDDLAELTVRFGPPAITTRSWRSGAIGQQDQYSDHWDPTLRTYVTPTLSKGVNLEARLDTVWPLDSLISRSGHAPPTIRRMRVLEHQAAQFGDGDRTLVISGMVRLDSLAGEARMTAAVFLLDSTLSAVARSTALLTTSIDSVTFYADVRLPADARYYSAEVYDPVSRLAARARYAIDSTVEAGAIEVSSILLAQPFDPGRLPDHRDSPLIRPLTRPVVSAGARFGVYAEISMAVAERRTVHVQIENSSLDRPSTLAKVVGWIGRTIGLGGGGRSPARLGWPVELQPGTANAIPVTLDLGETEPGRYELRLTVKDPETGTSVVVSREMLVVKEPGASRP